MEKTPGLNSIKAHNCNKERAPWHTRALVGDNEHSCSRSGAHAAPLLGLLYGTIINTVSRT